MQNALLNLLAAGLLAASVTDAALNIDTVPVGDAGNTGEVQSQGTFGAVSYAYHIGTHEVTYGQYATFLNSVASTDTHGLYNNQMDTEPTGGITRSGSSGSYKYNTKAGMANKPVGFVSFWDAARFANWLTNGQPTGAQGSGTTEDGMYNLGGVTNPMNTSVTRQLDFSLGQNGVAVASENEWYKAAYYDGNSGYFDYPTQSNTAPTAENPPGGANSANYNDPLGTVTDVGAYVNSASHYGTFDQGGNVAEWNDTVVDSNTRGTRGGSFASDDSFLKSSGRGKLDPVDDLTGLGFRVSSLAPIPEPEAYAGILGMMGLAMVLIRSRSRRQ